MNPAEVYELQVGVMDNVNSIWELWLGITFATIVAFHLGKDNISRLLLAVGSLLYLLASISIVMRYMAYTSAIGELNLQLVEEGNPGFPFPDWFPLSNSILTIVIFIFGTLATLTFAYVQTTSPTKSEGA